MLSAQIPYKITVREHKKKMMIQSTEDIGSLIRKVRNQLGVTQSDLALTAGTGLRFIVELEKGKATCQIGKVLQVLQVLGIQCHLTQREKPDAT